MGINEFQSVGNKARSVVSQVKVDTGYSYKTELEQYRARKAELEAKQDEVERTITDDDGGETEKPSALDYITASLTGIAGVLSSAAPLFQGNGGSSDNAGGGSEASTASKLDAAVEAYNKKASTKNKVALDKCLGEANAELAKVNEKIEPLETENASLQKALDGNFKDVFTSLKDGAKACKETRDKANTQAKVTDNNINSVIKAITDNTGATAQVYGLQQETNGQIAVIKGAIDIKVGEKAKQEDTLQSLSKGYQDAVEAIGKDETDISSAKDEINTANGRVDAAKAELSKAEAMGTTTTDKDGKPVKDSKKVDARNNAIKSAKEQQKAAEKELKAAQDKKEAAEALKKACGIVYSDKGKAFEIGEINGFKISAYYDHFNECIQGKISGEAEYTTPFSTMPSVNITKLERLVVGIEKVLNEARNSLAQADIDIQSANEILAKPFEHAQELKDKNERLTELTEELNAEAANRLQTAEKPQRTHYFGKAMILSNKAKEAPAQAQERSVEQDKSKLADVAI